MRLRGGVAGRVEVGGGSDVVFHDQIDRARIRNIHRIVQFDGRGGQRAAHRTRARTQQRELISGIVSTVTPCGMV
jgi:hypothetical protein